MSFLPQLWFERLFYAATSIIILGIAIAAFRTTTGTPLSPLKKWLSLFIAGSTLVVVSRFSMLAMLLLPSSASIHLYVQSLLLYDIHNAVSFYALSLLAGLLPGLIRDTNSLKVVTHD